MDLGAPILDVSAVTTGETTSSSTAIVTNGVVTAAGFDPIIITSTAANSGTDGRDVFIPTVDIYHSNTTIYRNISVGATDNSLKMNLTSQIAIIVLVTILLLIILGCVGRYVYYTVHHDKIKKADINAKQL
jgi:hypothetical protein